MLVFIALQTKRYIKVSPLLRAEAEFVVKTVLKVLRDTLCLPYANLSSAAVVAYWAAIFPYFRSLHTVLCNTTCNKENPYTQNNAGHTNKCKENDNRVTVTNLSENSYLYHQV